MLRASSTDADCEMESLIQAQQNQTFVGGVHVKCNELYYYGHILWVVCVGHFVSHMYPKFQSMSWKQNYTWFIFFFFFVNLLQFNTWKRSQFNNRNINMSQKASTTGDPIKGWAIVVNTPGRHTTQHKVSRLIAKQWGFEWAAVTLITGHLLTRLFVLEQCWL